LSRIIFGTIRQARPQFFVEVVSAYQNKKFSYIGHLLPCFPPQSATGEEIGWIVNTAHNPGVLHSMAWPLLCASHPKRFSYQDRVKRMFPGDEGAAVAPFERNFKIDRH